MEVKEKEKLKWRQENFSYLKIFNEQVNSFGKFQHNFREFVLYYVTLIKFKTHLVRFIENNARRFPLLKAIVIQFRLIMDSNGIHLTISYQLFYRNIDIFQPENFRQSPYMRERERKCGWQ